jgi:hypothetical protein
MKSQRISLTLIIGFVFLVLSLSLSACLPVGQARSAGGGSMQEQVSTQVAATLMQSMIETKVAEIAQSTVNSIALQVTATATSLPPAAAQPTATPVPTQTSVPTAVPPTPVPPTPLPPTAAPVVISYPLITANVNTNCRTGPSTNYTILTYLVQGATSYVHGRDSAHDWWYIEAPGLAGQFCWVWDQSTTVQGDTSTVPVVASSQAQTTSNYWTNYGYSQGGAGGCIPYFYRGKVYCLPNNGYINTTCCKKSCTNWNCTNWNCTNWNCSNWNNCNWNNCNCYNPCKKKPHCPPVNCYNKQNYCVKYPQCCPNN